MTTNKTNKSSHHSILSSFITIANLIVLLDESNLTPKVKTHCKLGLKVLSILHAHRNNNSGIDDLSNEEFDDFFSFLPQIYFKHRGEIPTDLIIQNIELCISTNRLNKIPE